MGTLIIRHKVKDYGNGVQRSTDMPERRSQLA
jgi:hypothetical protein